MDLKKIILMVLKREGKPLTIQHLFRLVDEEACFRYDENEVRAAIWPLISQGRLQLTADRKLKFLRMY